MTLLLLQKKVSRVKGESYFVLRVFVGIETPTSQSAINNVAERLNPELLLLYNYSTVTHSN